MNILEILNSTDNCLNSTENVFLFIDNILTFLKVERVEIKDARLPVQLQVDLTISS